MSIVIACGATLALIVPAGEDGLMLVSNAAIAQTTMDERRTPPMMPPPPAFGTPLQPPTATASSVTMAAPASREAQTSYRLWGAQALRPSGMSDDGVHTYVEWPANTPLPAIYIIDASGRESLANGAMRDGIYVIDSIEERFVFRLDRKAARAKRVTVREATR